MNAKVLIANRGEIAVRIIRACRELKIPAVSVYSVADSDCLHTYLADETVCIGAPSAADSYLNMQNIISAAVAKDAGMIHPGFGFLSENAEFAAICEDIGLTFIGPSAKSIALLGNKTEAKKTMKAAGVPVIPGSDGALKGYEQAAKLAQDIGYPVIVKAASGGGGRGIRIVHTEAELENAMSSAAAEAKSFFGDDSLYMEKYLTDTRHIEFQILADNYGNVIHLGERDCTLQRRNQKVLEESPSPVLSEELRQKMGDAAVRAARAAGYTNAGTVEFLLCGNDFYFMEMNTRIQVEHPVTEEVTGVDLIKQQIKISLGEPLGLTQEDVKISGHAIECRINAEDAERDFTPCVGEICSLHIPQGLGVRFDSHLYDGYKIPPCYDSMLGKLIVHAPTRQEAIDKAQRCLGEFILEGVTTNIPFLSELLSRDEVIKGEYDTGYIGSLTERSVK